MESLLEAGEHEVRLLRRGEMVDGMVVRVSSDEVMIDVGLKAEGVVIGRELYDPHVMDERPDLVVGESVPVYVLQPEGEGAAMLSIRRAMQERQWRDTEAVYNEGKIIEAKVTEFNKGGVLVSVGPRGFVPMSQLVSLAPSSSEDSRDDIADRLGQLVGKTLKMKIIEMDRRRNRLILSERAAERDLRSERRETLLEDLKVGQIRKGKVSNLATFGAFIDLGGADGLAHISELSWSRVSSPSEVLSPGQEIDVYILALDREEKKIALSIRRALPDPWEAIEERLAPEQVVEGTVTKLAPFGVFVRLEDGVEGLAHASDLDEDVLLSMREGDVRDFRILSVEIPRRRIRLVPADAGVESLVDYDEMDGGEGLVVGTSDDAGNEVEQAADSVEVAAEPEEVTDEAAAEAEDSTAEVATEPEEVTDEAAAEAEDNAAKVAAEPEYGTDEAAADAEDSTAKAAAEPENGTDAAADAEDSTAKAAAEPEDGTDAAADAEDSIDTDVVTTEAEADDADAAEDKSTKAKPDTDDVAETADN